jgi:hypothetical protein
VRFTLGRIIDMDDGQPVGRLDRIQEGDGRRMPVVTAQGCPRLADDLARRQDRLTSSP